MGGLLEVGREVTDTAEGRKRMIFQQFPAHSYTLFWTSHQSREQDQERVKEAHDLNSAFQLLAGANTRRSTANYGKSVTEIYTYLKLYE